MEESSKTNSEINITMAECMIHTKRLIIKSLTSDELKKYVDSPIELAKKLDVNPSGSMIDNETRNAVLNDLLPNIVDPNKDSLFYTMWIVIKKSEMRIVGGICFHGEPDEKGEIEIGYGTDEDYRNQGIMTETIAGIIRWIRSNKKVKIIIAKTDCDNISSVRVLEKNDFEIHQRYDNTVIMRLEI